MFVGFRFKIVQQHAVYVINTIHAVIQCEPKKKKKRKRNDGERRTRVWLRCSQVDFRAVHTLAQRHTLCTLLADSERVQLVVLYKLP